MAKTGTRKGRWEFNRKHYGEIWRAMKKVLDNETWDKTLPDTKLSDAIMEMGVWTSKAVTRDVRIRHGVGNSDQRRIELFAKQAKAKR